MAAGAGGVIGVLGGLIGLGGAEFRLPVLVAGFGYAPRRAVTLNLLMSLTTVGTAVASRFLIGSGTAAVGRHGDVALMLAVGGVAGAYLGSGWLRRARDETLHRAIRGLLLFLGVLMIGEGLTSWEADGLPLGPVTRAALGGLAGTGIGVVSAMLGVAGGELIIPTLVFTFGVDVKTAGTLSLLVSLPTLAVGLWRQRQQFALGDRAESSSS